MKNHRSCPILFPFFLFLLSVTAWGTAAQGDEPDAATGVEVEYVLPTEGPLPKTWRVTLAVTDPADPDNILSTFVAGEPVEVTADNQGKFRAVWDGLDDNFMPLPPGDYGLKGIAMPAEKWDIDGQWHSLLPRFVAAATAFQPSQDNPVRLPFSGDPVHSPMSDIDVSNDGILVFGYAYLENGRNNPMVDIKKPVGYDQFLRSFNSGGAGSCRAIATDGEHSWSFCPGDGGVPFVYRVDESPWGKDNARFRRNVFVPGENRQVRSVVTLKKDGKTEVYVALASAEGTGSITVLAGEDGTFLREIPGIAEPIVAMDGGKDGGLYVLLQFADQTYGVKRLDANAPVVKWTPPSPPSDLTVDRNGTIYVTYPEINAVSRLDPSGKDVFLIQGDGRGDKDRSGSYDPNWLIYPTRLTNWTDPEGKTRLLVLEMHGPSRVAEWTPEGKLIREWLSLQTWANDGYDADPLDPSKIYIPGHGDYLVRFDVDYATGKWTVDAVWPNVRSEPFGPAQKPRIVYANGQRYVAFEKKFAVYRFEGNRCLPAAGLFREDGEYGRLPWQFWQDADGNGTIAANEVKPFKVPVTPGMFIKYHGDRVLDDLSLVLFGQNTDSIWRLPVARFDEHGVPVYAEECEPLLTDPVFAAKKKGVVDALHGGNECATDFNSDWASVDGDVKNGFWVQARGGPNLTANFGAQYKLTRYDPDGQGGYKMRWRVGRAALQGSAKPGEIYGAMYVWAKQGLIGVVDQSRMGLLVYNGEGLYVDTLFPDERTADREKMGIYLQGGEFFSGRLTERDGQVYALLGKYTPEIFRIDGWDADFAQKIKRVSFPEKTITLTAARTASPPEVALRFRGGAGKAKLARFQPAVGGAPSLDGSLDDWLACEPVVFEASKDQTVEVRTMYDEKNIYLNWKVRLGDRKIAPKTAANPERMFTHDREADTLSFYLQTDPSATKAKDQAGRPGDARFVFALAREPGGDIVPAALGMYASVPNPDKAQPLTYTSPVGQAKFAHVGPVPGIKLGHKIDPDEKGFVLAVAIPVRAIPIQLPFRDGFRTMGNFDATFGGHNRFWWSNADGSANSETYDEPSEARLYPGAWSMFEFVPLGTSMPVRTWQVAGPWDNEENRHFKDGDENMKKAIVAYYEQYVTPPDDPKYPFWGDFGKGQARPWRLRSIEGTDPALKLSQAGRLFHQMTWIHVPEDLQVECRFHTRPMTQLRVSVVDEAMRDRQDFQFNNVKDEQRRCEVKLKKGWNRVLLRNYTFGYALQPGMTIHADAEILWKLRMSATPRP